MRILVTGREGQIARALIEVGGDTDHEIITVGRPELDLGAEPSQIHETLRAARPDVIVSAAAYTAVDLAESEPTEAFAVNAKGAHSVARSARSLGVPLIHLSTDYVFDGAKRDPYLEEDPTNPRTVYGASKLAGEQLVLAAHGDSVILRTAWVFSPFGNNFVRSMLRLAGNRDDVGVVDDQRGCPTSALDLSVAILKIAARLRSDRDDSLRGVFHLTNSGEASWAGLAKAVFAASQRSGGPFAVVHPIGTANYPTPAPRPANSRLDCDLVNARYGIVLGPWRNAVDAVVDRLVRTAI